MNSRLSTPFFEQKIRKWRTNERQKFIVSSFLVAFVRRVNGIELNVGCVVGCVDGGRQQKWTWKQLWNASTATERPSTRRNHIVVIHRLWFECGRSEQQQKKTNENWWNFFDGRKRVVVGTRSTDLRKNKYRREEKFTFEWLHSFLIIDVARPNDRRLVSLPTSNFNSTIFHFDFSDFFVLFQCISFISMLSFCGHNDRSTNDKHLVDDQRFFLLFAACHSNQRWKLQLKSNEMNVGRRQKKRADERIHNGLINWKQLKTIFLIRKFISRQTDNERKMRNAQRRQKLITKSEYVGIYWIETIFN